ncbi:MAG: hypothetical protein WCV69_03905 [Patescibacteria group bacterium]|jgi:hypothetical protein
MSQPNVKCEPECELCQKARSGAHRVGHKIAIPTFIVLFTIISALISSTPNIYYKIVLILLGLWLLIAIGEPIFLRHREYWFMDKGEPHAHRLLPRGINNEPLVDTYCEVSIGGHWGSRIFIRGHELVGYFDWSYFQVLDHDLSASGLQASDDSNNRLRFKFAELPQLFELLDRPQGEVYNRLTGLLLAEHANRVRYQQERNQHEDERQTHQVRSEALQQVILILADRVSFYRRTLGNSKYGRFTDSFLRRAWLNIFGQPLDTEKQNRALYPALHQLGRDSLIEIGIREEEDF